MILRAATFMRNVAIIGVSQYRRIFHQGVSVTPSPSPRSFADIIIVAIEIRVSEFDNATGRLIGFTQFPAENARRLDTHLDYCAVRPPSMTNSLPVMNDDSSEARKRTP